MAPPTPERQSHSAPSSKVQSLSHELQHPIMLLAKVEVATGQQPNLAAFRL